MSDLFSFELYKELCNFFILLFFKTFKFWYLLFVYLVVREKIWVLKLTNLKTFAGILLGGAQPVIPPYLYEYDQKRLW